MWQVQVNLAQCLTSTGSYKNVIQICNHMHGYWSQCDVVLFRIFLHASYHSTIMPMPNFSCLSKTTLFFVSAYVRSRFCALHFLNMQVTLRHDRIIRLD